MTLVNCSNCHTPLQLPPGAKSFRCAICQAITHLGDHHTSLPRPHTGGHPVPAPSSFAFSQPSAYNDAPPGPPPSAHGRKKALIVGISYKFSPHELKGCINDAKCMKYLLINKFQFPEASIIMLTEEETDPFKIPNNTNMRNALLWLVEDCQPGDSLVFHYSGHGSQLINYNGDEVEGYSQTLWPLDFETEGMLLDDEINENIVNALPLGVKFHAIIDACHSGTVMDLPFLCRMNRSGQYVWEDHRTRSDIWEGSNGGEVICISGCDDDQTSADTSALSKIASMGAMTYCFIQAVEHGNASTYGSLLGSMRRAIRNARTNMNDGGAVTALLTMLLAGGSLEDGVPGGLSQEPQLTASQPFDVYAKPFSL